VIDPTHSFRLPLKSPVGALLVCLLTVLVASSARANESFVCPRPDDERTCAKLEHKYVLRREKLREIAALNAHREAHPWKLRLSLVPTVAFFGLESKGSSTQYSAEMWGLGSGLSVLREYRYAALVVEGLARIGVGSIHSWSARGGNPHRGTGLIAGGELHAEFRFRRRYFFGGPAASIGVLHFQNDRDLYERESDGGSAILVPRNASFAVVGGALGREVGPPGRAEIGARALVGAWNHFDRGYVQLSFTVACRLWN
jgi:hypothetical protein